LRTKVNANIGSSPEMMKLDFELKKLAVSVKYGADTVMDLSLGVILNDVRKKVLEKSTIPVGTVPIYQTGFEISRKKKKIEELTIDNFCSVLESQGKEGVDFVTIHSGVTLKSWEFIKQKNRLLDVVSRGGSMLCVWMEYNKEENPLYTHFDRILEIAYRYDMTISLGDGMRPGATSDASDSAQMEELITLGSLARRAREANVQVIIEGPGHIALDQVVSNIFLQKSLCDGAPFYILGPLVTDIASGYDHISGAIGGALAASAGADFLCYVTPAEHLCLPGLEDVKQGVIASRIAAHAGDMVKYGNKFKKIDNEMSLARKRLDWDTMYRLSVDPENARKRREASGALSKDYCTMCGEFCSVRALNRIENRSASK
jgi:phosphomethylpyrimidine synthase